MTTTADLCFLQGVFAFVGEGLERPAVIDDAMTFTVPAGQHAQVLYFRGGNSSTELVLVVLERSGVPMRYFPIGARGDVHVPLRVMEDVAGGESLQLRLAAPTGVSGSVVVDVGIAIGPAGV